ncbi:hypothetical protein EGW08_014458 [Elysia chlorotica]|uniref:Amino acid transporter n=1 Tax=Elysia chlorotica TaxID=188477 RepID=A0A3S1BY05_ELYCH|nr:hypothetical protein EGW08_014458 [Elysia chlorotica]
MRERTAHYGTLREVDDEESAEIGHSGKSDSNSANSKLKDQGHATRTATTSPKSPAAESASCAKRLARHARNNLLLVALASALVLGVVLGVAVRLLAPPLNAAQQEYLEFPGEILMNMLKLLILPLIVSSLISGMTTLDSGASGAHSRRELVQEDGINMLGLVVFSLAVGVGINHIGEPARPLRDLVQALMDVTMFLVNAVIWYSPVGILFLVAGQVAGLADAGESVRQLGMYMLTVLVGLALHGLVVLPLIYFTLVRKNPYRFMGGVLEALVTALGTSSSSATLPVTMRNLQENNGIDPRVISFVIPVGATVNMDGTALYEAVATIFIGQVNGLDLNLGKIITICITATAASIGAAGVPQAGLVTMVIVLDSVGFPTSGIAMVLAVDWMLDRVRTVVNVLGDAYGAGIVNHYSRDEAGGLSSDNQMPLLPGESPATETVVVTEGKPRTNGLHVSSSAGLGSPEQQTSFYQR